MPRPSSSFVPKYCKHRASGQAVVTISGRDHYLGPHGTKASRLEYDRLIGEWLVAGRHSLDVNATEITVIELIARYWQFAKGYYRKDGECTREAPGIKQALKPLKNLYGKQPATEFGPIGLKVIRSRLVENDTSRKYANKQIQRIVRMFKWAVHEELISPTVHLALAAVPGLRKGKTEARETDPIMPVDDAIVDATLAYLPAIPGDMVQFQRFTGCRPAEVCRLRPCALDQSEEVWTYRPESHKTEHHDRDRIIFIGPHAQGVLLRYLARDPQTHCFRPCDSEAKRLAEQEAKRKTPLSCDNVRGSNVSRRCMPYRGKWARCGNRHGYEIRPWRDSAVSSFRYRLAGKCFSRNRDCVEELKCCRWMVSAASGRSTFFDFALWILVRMRSVF
jgi:integrase